MMASEPSKQSSCGWYAASCDMGERLAGLTNHIQADVCVVGAGFTGLSAALELALAGRDVVILEAKQVGWGGSGRNGGHLIHGFVGYDKMLKRYNGAERELVKQLKWHGHNIIERRIADYQIDCDLQHGWIELAHTKRQLTQLKEEYSSAQKNEPEKGWALLDKNAVHATMQSNTYVGGLLSKSSGHLHPLKLCRGLRNACLKEGVRIYEATPVTAIKEGSPCQITTPEGAVTANQVVLAANAHHTLFKSVLSGYSYAAGSFMMATEPLPETTRQAISRDGWAYCDTRKVCDYYRVTPQGRILFGGRVNYSGRKPRSIEAALMPRLLDIWPQLEGIRAEYEWGGKLGVTISQSPMVDTIGENIYYTFGYTGHGLNTSNMIGKVVADAILGDRQTFELFARMPKWRLPFGPCIGQQLVAAAILYYKITDRL